MTEKPASEPLAEKICISDESFDEQLQEKQSFQTENGGQVEYFKIQPEEITSEVPVVYVGGFSQGPTTYTDEMKDLARSGRAVLYTNPIRGDEKVATPELLEVQEKYNLPDVIVNKVADIDALLTQSGAEKVDLVGHSQGGVLSAVLSALRPDKVRNVVMECSAGFQGPRSTWGITGSFAWQMGTQGFDIVKEAGKWNWRLFRATTRAGRSFAREMATNYKDIKWRFRTEIPGLMEIDIAPILADIKSLAGEPGDARPRVTMLNANNDKLFKPKLYEAGLDFDADNIETGEGEGPFKYVDSWLMYARKGAGHNAPASEEEGLLRQILN